MDKTNNHSLEGQEGRLEYPTINDLYPLSKKLDGNNIIKRVKKLRKKRKENVMWVKRDVILTDYLNKDLKSEGLSNTITKVLTYTYPFHNNKRKLTFLKKLLLVLLEMNLSAEVGKFRGEFILYYKMIVLFPNYRASETMHDELNQLVNYVQSSGKTKPLDNYTKFNESFKELIISIIKEFRNKNTGRVNFLQTNDPYSIVERLERKPDLSIYANLITLTSFQGSLSRGITLDYPCTFLMISDIAQCGSLYLAGNNAGYNNAKQVSNSIVQAYARSLRLFKESELLDKHPLIKRSSNLRVLGWSSHLNEKYSSYALKDSILRDLSEGSLHGGTNLEYSPNILIEEVLKKNYMLDVIDGPDLTGSTEVDLNRTQSESTFDEGEGENKTDVLLNSIRRYFYANTLQSALSDNNANDLEKQYEFGSKTGPEKSAFTPEKGKTYNGRGTTRENQLEEGQLSIDLKTHLNLRLKRELAQLATLPVEVKVKIKWSSGKGKFDRLRNSETITEKAISDGDKSVVVSMSRLLGLPVYSEIRRNKMYRDFLCESSRPTLGRDGQIKRSEFDQLTKNIKEYCSEYIRKLLATTPSVYGSEKITCSF